MCRKQHLYEIPGYLIIFASVKTHPMTYQSFSNDMAGVGGFSTTWITGKDIDAKTYPTFIDSISIFYRSMAKGS